MYELTEVAKERFYRRSDESVSQWISHWLATHDQLLRRETPIRANEVDIEGIIQERAKVIWVDLRDYWLRYSVPPQIAKLSIDAEAGIDYEPPDWFVDCRVGKLKLPRWMEFKGVECSSTKHYILKMAEIAALRKWKNNDKKFTLVVTCEPESYLRMGHNACDSDSCYKAGSEFRHAPVNLATVTNSVVYYLKDGDNVIARAWGIATRDGWVVTNVYAKGLKGGKSFATQLFTRGMHKLYGEKEVYGASLDYDSDLFYLNGDAFGTNDDWELHPAYPCNPEGRLVCEWCSESVDEDYVIVCDGDSICENCGHNHCVWSEYNNEYIRDDDSFYCEHRCEYFYDHQVVTTYNGDYVYEGDAIEINLGTFSSGWANPDDCALLQTDDGDFYIDGTYDEQESEDNDGD